MAFLPPPIEAGVSCRSLDEGTYGTSLAHRDNFKKMIEDCYSGKIDIVITKSISRFSRNLDDCVDIVRKLAALPRPVGVIFE